MTTEITLSESKRFIALESVIQRGQKTFVEVGCALERPILFNGAMVCAILEGRKTQTRRMVKPSAYQMKYCRERWGSDATNETAGLAAQINLKTYPDTCPYGRPGARLWVRETHHLWSHSFESVGVEYMAGGDDKIADLPNDKMPSLEVLCRRGVKGQRLYRPSIYMPRWASRITLEITGVRVERLQSISPFDAIAEGIDTKTSPHDSKFCYMMHGNFPEVCCYATLWESINGKGSWDKNPWVWVITFKRL